MQRVRSSDFKTDHDKTAPAAPRLICRRLKCTYRVLFQDRRSAGVRKTFSDFPVIGRDGQSLVPPSLASPFFTALQARISRRRGATLRLRETKCTRSRHGRCRPQSQRPAESRE